MNHLNKFSPLSRGGPTLPLSSVCSVISKKNLNTHMHIHTRIKELLALNTVHVPVFLHTRTNSLEFFQMKKCSGCMCTFANQIKIIKVFKYEKMQVNIVYFN